MPTPDQREMAGLLVRKAASDLAAARLLASDLGQLDDVVGFHVQQAIEKAIEKAIKSTLAATAIEVPRTHDLTYLLELAAESGIAIPLTLDDAELLTPWSVVTRYDDVSEELDRVAAIGLAATTVAWASEFCQAAD